MTDASTPRKNGSSASRKYRAYISYEVGDNQAEGRRWAVWLQEALENFRVPAKFVGSPDGKGDRIPRTVFPVYRAHEAGSDAKKDLEALRDSDALVVLASPNSAKDKRVCDDVRRFKEWGKGDRIVVLMVRGEPRADIASKADLGIRPEDECLAEELRYGKTRRDGTVNWGAPVEPLCADVRVVAESDSSQMTTGEAYTNELPWYQELVRRGIPATKAQSLADSYAVRLERAKTTVVAGVLGLSSQELLQQSGFFRERRLKHGIIALTATAVALGVFAMIGFFGGGSDLEHNPNGGGSVSQTRALKASEEREAQLNRKLVETEREAQEAAGKIRGSQVSFEKMTVDLLAGLQPSVRAENLDEMKAAIEVARLHFEGIPSYAVRPADQANLASVLETEARLFERSENFDGTLKKLEESLRLVESNRDAYPDSVSWLAKQSDLRHWIGGIRLDQEKLDGAEQSFKSALILDQELSDLQPEEVKWRQNLSAGREKIARIQEAKGMSAPLAVATPEPDSAEPVEIAEVEAPKTEQAPSPKEETADSLVAEAKILASTGDLDGAIGLLESAIEKTEPSDPAQEVSLATWQLRMAALLRSKGDVESASAQFGKALARVNERGLTLNEPEARNDLASGLESRSRALAEAGNQADALSQLQEALRLWTDLAQTHPNDPQTFVALCESHSRAAKLLESMGQTEAAQANRVQAVEYGKTVVQLQPQALEGYVNLAEAFENLAKWQPESEASSALQSYQGANEIRAQIYAADPSDLEHLRNLAQSHQDLGVMRWRANDLNGAVTNFQSLIGLAGELQKRDAENRGWIELSASTHRYLAQLYAQLGDSGRAEQSSADALAQMELLLADEPGNAELVAQIRNDYQVLALANRAQAKLVEAKAMLVEAGKLGSRLAVVNPEAGPSSGEIVLEMEAIADISLEMGDLAAARQEYDQARTMAQQFAEANPEDLKAQAKLATLTESTGDVMVALDDYSSAETYFAQCLEIAAENANRDPSEDAWWQIAGACHAKIGSLHQMRDDLPKAKVSYEAAIQAFDYLIQRSPTNLDFQSELSTSYGKLGEVTLKMGQSDAALAHFQRGFNLQEELLQREPDNATWQNGIAMLAFRIGQIHSANRSRRDAITWLNRAKEQIETLETRNLLREENRWLADAVSEEIRSQGRFRVLGGAP